MAQFDVHRNSNPTTKGRFPLLLNVQSDLLDPLATRVVIPLTPALSSAGRQMDTLTPKVTLEGKDFVVMTPLLAGVAARDLGQPTGNLIEERAAILASLDLLVTGI